MKGQNVKRSTNLVMLATTSLYGVDSSQYNRVRVRLEALGGEPGVRIEYKNVSVSDGYGSCHFLAATGQSPKG
jgi:hypothetical protein